MLRHTSIDGDVPFASLLYDRSLRLNSTKAEYENQLGDGQDVKQVYCTNDGCVECADESNGQH